MAMFNSYVSLPEGIWFEIVCPYSGIEQITTSIEIHADQFHRNTEGDQTLCSSK